jgi:hypothetical protein
MRWFVLVTVVLTLMAFGAAAEDHFSVSGRVTATEQEMQEGYFAIDQETMLVARPHSPLQQYLKAQVGRRVRITIEPANDEGPDSTR